MRELSMALAVGLRSAREPRRPGLGKRNEPIRARELVLGLPPGFLDPDRLRRDCAPRNLEMPL